jgi:GNAT superfamily N-acetyltransferase
MNSTSTIRLAGLDDAQDLASLLHKFNTEFDTPTPGVAVLAPRVRSLLAGSSTFAVLADSDNPIGFALVTLRPNVWFDGPVALVDELYVKPMSRGSGIGTALMARVEQECRARSVDYLEINVDAGDTDARRFYERLGYRGVDPDTGEPALYYSRELV